MNDEEGVDIGSEKNSNFVNDLSQFCLLLFSFLLGSIVSRIMFYQEWFGILDEVNHIFNLTATLGEIRLLLGLIFFFGFTPSLFFMAYRSFKRFGLFFIESNKMNIIFEKVLLYILGFIICSIPYPMIYISNLIRGNLSISASVPMFSFCIIAIFISICLIFWEKIYLRFGIHINEEINNGKNKPNDTSSEQKKINDQVQKKDEKKGNDIEAQKTGVETHCGHENPKRFSLLMRQYSESLSYLRHLDSLVWQIPALSIAINSLLLNQYFTAERFENRLFVLFTALIFTFVFSIALQKHRFSSNARQEDFKWYENELIEYFPNEKMRKMVIITANVYCDKENYPSVIRNWWRREGAYTWLWFSMKLSMIIIALFILNELGLLSFLVSCLHAPSYK